MLFLSHLALHNGEVLFCKYCQHSIDYVRVDTIKDHLKAQKHISRKEAKLKARQERTVQLVAAVWSNIVYILCIYNQRVGRLSM